MPDPTRVAAAANNEILLGFDFGERRLGVAIGNSLVGEARPLQTISAASTDERFARITDLLAAWQPQRLVVGIPYHVDGTPHAMTARCVRFANQLHGRYGLPVERVDERYTSADAESRLRAAKAGTGRRGGPTVREQVDAEAAAVILQSWFEQCAASRLRTGDVP